MIPVIATMFGASGQAQGALHVGTQAGNGDETVWPAALGAEVGDLAVLTWSGTGSPSSGSGGAWTEASGDISGGGYTPLSYRLLTAADLAAPIAITNFTGTAWLLAIYRGATSIVEASKTTVAAGSRTLTGFTKNVAHKGIIAFSVKNQTSGGSGNSSFDTPATFAFRDMATASASGSQRRIRLYDRLTPPNETYVDSTVFGVTAAAANQSTFTVFELR